MDTQLNNYVYCTLQEVYQDLGFDADNLNSCIYSAAEKFAGTLCEIAAIDNSEYLTYLFKYYVTPRC